MACSLLFAACGNDDVDKGGNSGGGTTEQPEDITFSAQIDEVSLTSATYSVTPSDLEAEYLVFFHDAKSVEQCDIDAEIITMLYDEVRAYAEANNTTFEAFLADKVKRGVVERAVIDNLNPGTNYYLLIFGVDSTNGFATTTVDVTKKRFSTEAPEQSTCTFELKSTVNLTTVALKVTPSNNDQLWHLINVTVEDYQKYTAADGEYGWTKDEYFQNYLNTEIETLKEQGLSNDEIGVKLFHKGLRTLNDSGLSPKTKYASFVAAVDYADGAAYVTSSLKELRYTSGEAAQSDLTFDIDVYNVGHYSAEVRITPSDLDAEYYYYIGYIDNAKKSMKPVEIANAAITEYIYYWENYTELKLREPSKGVVDLTGDNKVELNIAETEYFIVAFSFEPNPTYGQVIDEEAGEYDYNPGTIKSAPVYVSFKTSEQGDPMAATFEFSTSDVGPYDFYLDIKTSDPTVYYQPGIAYADGFDPQAAINASASDLSMLYQMTMEGQNPCLTFHEALETRLKDYYRNGDRTYYIANLEPEKSFIGYVLVIDPETHTFVNCVYSDVIATTKPLGSVTPTAEILGYYNGNDENGSVFGDADATAGRSIVAVKFSNIENATAVYSALSSDAYADVVGLADRYIHSEFRNYWQPIESFTAPYHFYVADWDCSQTVVAYALDANGDEGNICKLEAYPTGTPDDINELIGYAEEVRNAKPAMAKSMVIAETAEPSMQCIWSENVPAPRAAEVTYHEVEPLKSVESDLVRVKVIKSFRL